MKTATFGNFSRKSQESPHNGECSVNEVYLVCDVCFVGKFASFVSCIACDVCNVSDVGHVCMGMFVWFVGCVFLGTYVSM